MSSDSFLSNLLGVKKKEETTKVVEQPMIGDKSLGGINTQDLDKTRTTNELVEDFLNDYHAIYHTGRITLNPFAKACNECNDLKVRAVENPSWKFWLLCRSRAFAEANVAIKGYFSKYGDRPPYVVTNDVIGNLSLVERSVLALEQSVLEAKRLQDEIMNRSLKEQDAARVIAEYERAKQAQYVTSSGMELNQVPVQPVVRGVDVNSQRIYYPAESAVREASPEGSGVPIGASGVPGFVNLPQQPVAVAREAPVQYVRPQRRARAPSAAARSQSGVLS